MIVKDVERFVRWSPLTFSFHTPSHDKFVIKEGDGKMKTFLRTLLIAMFLIPGLTIAEDVY